jgi:hypothetical protein
MNDSKTCTVDGCPNPPMRYAPSDRYPEGYPASMCSEHDAEFSRFRREMAKRTGSSRGAGKLFREEATAKLDEEDREMFETMQGLQSDS